MPKENEQAPHPKSDSYSPVRISPATRSILDQLLERANQKELGKRIKSEEIVALSLSLVNDQHIARLQEQSLSNADRLELQFRKYAKENGAISRDEFIGKLLVGEIKSS